MKQKHTFYLRKSTKTIRQGQLLKINKYSFRTINHNHNNHNNLKPFLRKSTHSVEGVTFRNSFKLLASWQMLAAQREPLEGGSDGSGSSCATASQRPLPSLSTIPHEARTARAGEGDLEMHCTATFRTHPVLCNGRG